MKTQMPDDDLGLAELLEDDEPDLSEWGITDSDDDAESLDPFEETEGFEDWEEDEDDYPGADND
jgi:hypothetical protein